MYDTGVVCYAIEKTLMTRSTVCASTPDVQAEDCNSAGTSYAKSTELYKEKIIYIQ